MPPVVGAVASFVASAVVSTALSFAVSYISQISAGQRKVSNPKSQAPKPQSQQAVEQIAAAASPLANSADPGGAQIGIFGRGRVGGRVILSAQASDGKNYKILNVAGSPVTVNAIYLNNGLISRDVSDNVTTSPWKLAGKTSSYAIKAYDGTQIAADAVLKAAFPAWTNSMIGLKQTYLRCVVNTAADAAYAAVYQSGDPDITVDVLGFPAFDPRDLTQDVNVPATWKATKNAALIAAGYLMHELGRDLPAANIDWDSVSRSANICDEDVALASGLSENRYECFLVWQTSERHEDVLQRVADAMAGRIYRLGDKYIIEAGTFDDSAAVDLTPDDYAGDGLAFADCVSIDSICNGVRGKFASPSSNYEMRDYPAYQDAAALAEDEGLEYWLDGVDFPAVNSPSQAQRLARIRYNQTRKGASGSVDLKFKHFDTIRGDIVRLTDDLAGMDAITFRVEADKLSGDDYVVTLDLFRDEAGNYAWSVSDEQPMPPSVDLSSAGGIGVNPDNLGTLQPPGFELTPAAGYARSHVQWRITFRASPSARATHYNVKLSYGSWTLVRTGSGAGTSTSKEPDDTSTTPIATSAIDTPAAAKDLSNITAGGTTFNLDNAWNGRSTPTLTVAAYCTVSSTGETSPNNTVTTSAQFSAMGGAPYNSVSTTPIYKLAPPPAPQIAALGAGTATINYFSGVSPRTTHIELWENTTNNFTTATRVVNAANANGSYAASGSLGQTKYYWTRARNSADGSVSPVSNVLLVGF